MKKTKFVKCFYGDGLNKSASHLGFSDDDLCTIGDEILNWDCYEDDSGISKYELYSIVDFEPIPEGGFTAIVKFVGSY